MRAGVLVPRGAAARAQTQIYDYAVPGHLAATLAPGHLVEIPFGERATVGIVWTLDAGDDVAPTAASETDASQASLQVPPQLPLRPITRIVSGEPLLLPAQLALAEWIAERYAAPLGTAARLMLPPGLLSSVRMVLRPSAPSPADDPHAMRAYDRVPDDESALLALLRARGTLDFAQIVAALGAARARAAIRALLRTGRAVLAAEAPDVLAPARRERRVRLLAPPDALDEWRAAARDALDHPDVEAVRPGMRRDAGRDAGKARASERGAERLLRQLAVLDVLARPSRGDGAHSDGAHSDGAHGDGAHGDGAADAGAWRIEDLRRLTRATAPALTELRDAGLIAFEDMDVRHDPLAGRAFPRTHPLPLTPAQAAALAAIARAGEAGVPRTFLLHGITGSGKTEVYLQALAATLARGRRGIVLVPEIALTPQAMARYAGRFPGRVALLHSGLTDAERLSAWRRIRAGEVDVVLGSRSALFAPVDRLGLIVVDEEHEAAYKQDNTPTYSARDAAVRLGMLAGAAVVLGSATPSVESTWLAREGVYTLLELRERAPVAGGGDGSTAPPPDRDAADPTPAGENEDEGGGAAAPSHGLPPVTVIDLRAELRAGNTSILSAALQEALRETLDRGEQAILFLNRRGTASSVVCRECGYVARCGDCDISMTFHAGERAIICHYCGRREAAPALCPVCRGASIRYFGLGTERVEAAVKRQFPTARVLRWDRDTAKTRQIHEELLRAFTERRADVLVGTQMIAKGLDLPAVTLVGVVSADIALFLPDFRASERAFQLLTQVAGRAGRGDRPGRVLVQTFNPDHFCIQAAARHDYAAFVAAELDARQRYGYPPFRRFVQLIYAHPDRYTAQLEATALAEELEHTIVSLGLEDTDLVGPSPAFMERLRGRYRWQVILRGPDPLPIVRALGPERLPRGWSLVVDPATTL